MLGLAPMYVHSNRYRAEAGALKLWAINYAAEVNQRLAKGIVGEFLYPRPGRNRLAIFQQLSAYAFTAAKSMKSILLQQ